MRASIAQTSMPRRPASADYPARASLQEAQRYGLSFPAGGLRARSATPAVAFAEPLVANERGIQSLQGDPKNGAFKLPSHINPEKEKNFIEKLKTDIRSIQRKLSEIFAVGEKKGTRGWVKADSTEEGTFPDDTESRLSRFCFSSDPMQLLTTKLSLVEILTSKLCELDRAVLRNLDKGVARKDGVNPGLPLPHGLSHVPSFLALVDSAINLEKSHTEKQREVVSLREDLDDERDRARRLLEETYLLKHTLAKATDEIKVLQLKLAVFDGQDVLVSRRPTPKSSPPDTVRMSPEPCRTCHALSNEVQQLSDELHEHRQHADALRNENRDLRERLDVQTATVLRLKAIDSERTTARAAREPSQQDKGSGEAEPSLIQSLQHHLAAKDQTIAELKQTLEAFKSDLVSSAQVRGTTAATQQQMQNAQREIHRLSGETERQRRRADEAETALAELAERGKNAAEQVSRIEDLQAKLQVAQSRAETLDKELKAASRQSQKLSLAVEAASSENREVAQKLRAEQKLRETQAESHSQQLRAAESRLEEAKKLHRADASASAEREKEKAQALQATKQELDKAIQQSDATSSRLRREKQALEDAKARLHGDITRLEAEISSMRKDMEALQAAKVDADNARSLAEAAVEELMGRVRALEKDKQALLDEVRSNNDTAESRLASLRAILGQQSAEDKAAADAAHQAEVLRLQTRLRELSDKHRDEIASVQRQWSEQTAALRHELASSKSAAEQTQNDLLVARHRIQSESSSVDRLKAELEQETQTLRSMTSLMKNRLIQYDDVDISKEDLPRIAQFQQDLANAIHLKEIAEAKVLEQTKALSEMQRKLAALERQVAPQTPTQAQGTEADGPMQRHLAAMRKSYEAHLREANDEIARLQSELAVAHQHSRPASASPLKYASRYNGRSPSAPLKNYTATHRLLTPHAPNAS